MVKQAEQHAADDKSRREQIERRNRLDALVYEVEKNSKEWADRLDTANKERLNQAVESAKQALRAGDPDAIQKALDELSQAYSAAGTSLYEAARAQSSEGGSTGDAGAGPQPGAAGETKPDDVVEADYEVVDDDKK
jgi:molecular chaperone DnaK